LPKVEWTEDALKDLDKIDRQIAKRIVKKVTWLSRHFEDVVPEKLSGDLSGMYKLRVGDWRAIYSIESDALIVVAVGHRREVYG
jgi:mRNA interferase RelE/StbE